MSSPPFLSTISLNRSYFGLFLALQVALAAALLLLAEQDRIVLYIGLLGVVAIAFLAFLSIYPWLVIPIIIATTSLDIAGRLLEKTPIGIPLTSFHLSLMLMFVATAVNIAFRKRQVLPPFSLLGPLALFWGLIAVSQLYSPNQPEAVIGLFRILFLILFLYGVELIIDSRKAVNWVIVTNSICVIVASGLGIVQVFTEEFYLPASFVLDVGANTPRATGTFHNPNHLGTFLMAGVVLLTTLLINLRMALWKQLLAFGTIVIGMGGLLTTFSRGNWVATLVGLIMALALAKKLRYFFITAILFVLAVLALKEFVPIAEYLFQRFVSIFTLFSEFESRTRVSSTARIYFVLAGLGMFLDNPILGAGWRAFPVILDAYKPDNFPHWLPTRESHTLFATILGELGLLGGAAALWIVVRVFKRGFGALKSMQDPYLRAVTLSLLTVFVSFQVTLTFTGDLPNNFFWLFTGLLFAVIRIEREAREGGPT